eukprot:11207375-Lingulodinium_polyedra.AAC.1
MEGFVRRLFLGAGRRAGCWLGATGYHRCGGGGEHRAPGQWRGGSRAENTEAIPARGQAFAPPTRGPPESTVSESLSVFSVWDVASVGLFHALRMLQTPCVTRGPSFGAGSSAPRSSIVSCIARV